MIHLHIYNKIPLFLLLIPLIVMKCRHRNIHYFIIFLCSVIYAINLFGVLFFPIVFDIPIDDAETVVMVNLIPFKTISEMYLNMPSYVFIKQIFGNILLLIPFGFLIPILFKRITSFLKLVICSLIFSIAVEFLQLFINVITKYPNRASDIDDIILNVIGAIIGFLILKIVNKLLIKVFNYDLFKICLWAVNSFEPKTAI